MGNTQISEEAKPHMIHTHTAVREIASIQVSPRNVKFMDHL